MINYKGGEYMAILEIKEENAPHHISVAIEPKDWVWLQTHKGARMCKASSLLRMAIREKMADESGSVWPTKHELAEKLKKMQEEMQNLWKAIQESGAESSVCRYYENSLKSQVAI
jgi:ABC-type ATPase involved in cell division